MIKRIFSDIKKGENLDLIIILPIALVFLVLDLIGGPGAFIKTDSLFIAVAAIIALSLLKQRHLILEIEEKREKNDHTQLNFQREGIVSIRQDLPHSELSDILKKGKKIKLLKSFFPASNTLEISLVDCLRNKAEIVIYMLDPNSEILRTRSEALGNVTIAREHIIRGLKIIHNEISKDASVFCEVNFFDWWPGSPIIVVDSRLFLGYYMVSAPSPEFPWIEVEVGSNFHRKLMHEFEKIESKVLTRLSTVDNYDEFMRHLA